MSELDRKIHDALAAEEKEMLERYSELPMSEQVIESFRGKNRWLVVLTVVATITFVVLSVFAAVRFFQAEDLRESVGWAVGLGWGLLAIAMSKIWYWMELNKLAILREIKRIELKLTRLSDSTK